MSTYWCVDLGATSGRLMSVRLDGDRVTLHEQARFANRPVDGPSGLVWDVETLWAHTLDGLAAAAARSEDLPVALAVDGWGVDVGFVGPDGTLAAPVQHYRSATAEQVERVHRRIPAPDLYARTGLVPMAINTVYRVGDALAPLGEGPLTMLPVSDLWAFLLSGVAAAELTNAGTTSLLDVRTRTWDLDLLALLGVRADVLPPLVPTGTPAGPLLPAVARRTGLPADLPVLRAVGHDTQAAVAAIPGQGRVAFVSCGTWAMVGVETDLPVTGADALAAGFTNELSADGGVLFMRNLSGLWLLEEVLAGWRRRDPTVTLERVLAEAEAAHHDGVVDVGDERLVTSRDVEADLHAACRAAGVREPQGRGETVRCILHSLAVAFHRTLQDCHRLTGHPVDVVHLVGGGTRNTLLCRLVADVCGVPVVVGPAEASSVGNALVQARVMGEITDREHLRAVVAAGLPPVVHEPGARR